MKIHLKIERLILEGIPLAPHEQVLFQQALEFELGSLLANLPQPGREPAGIALAGLRAGEIELALPANPLDLGRQVASQVHASLALHSPPFAQPVADTF